MILLHLLKMFVTDGDVNAATTVGIQDGTYKYRNDITKTSHGALKIFWRLNFNRFFLCSRAEHCKFSRHCI